MKHFKFPFSNSNLVIDSKELFYFQLVFHSSGGFAIATWCMSCCVTTSLFLNRVISVAFHGLSNSIEKKLAYICIFLCIFYGFYVLFFTPVVCFNSEWLIWLPDPLSETKPSEQAAEYYRNRVQAWNNWIFVTCMFVLFTLYLGMINKISMGQKSKAAKSVSGFIQNVCGLKLTQMNCSKIE